MVITHSEILLSKCAQFREEGEFVDVRLKVGKDVFRAHRIVLAANSDYFHAMFAHGMKESNQEVIELKDESISAVALEIVMDSMYSEDLDINDENVFEVLLAADHLQVTSVVQKCCNYLLTEFVQLRFDVQTYCRICIIADRHGLTELQEATHCKMASMYKEICESEEFLTHIDADQLLSLLSRDDLSAPSETFVFISVMQWIKYKKEERLSVAAKVIGAVRLGLVDIKDVIRELNTEEMKQVPEIFMLLHESLLYACMPSSTTFDEDKAKPRSAGQVLIAVLPHARMQYFDVEAKMWEQLPSLKLAAYNANFLHCAQTVGNKLFVTGYIAGVGYGIYSYDIERNVWKNPYPLSVGEIVQLCAVGDYMYAISADCNKIPQRYSFAESQWQSFAKVNVTNNYDNYFYNSGATVLHSKVFVLYGKAVFSEAGWFVQNAVLHCFDPVRNVWDNKSSTCHPHFGSSLFVVNNRLYIAGGFEYIEGGMPCGKTASVEVYDNENNKWSVVEQKHIPQNKLGAVEIEGRVYFIINKFPFDSGIRIPPGEVYPVHLDEWKNLANISEEAVLCYMPVKRESLKIE